MIALTTVIVKRCCWLRLSESFFRWKGGTRMNDQCYAVGPNARTLANYPALKVPGY